MEVLNNVILNNILPNGMSNLKVTNIKISFFYDSQLLINEAKCLSYFKKHNFIVKSKDFSYTFLGRSKQHVNITGIKSFNELKNSVINLLDFSNFQLHKLHTIKVDNISSTFTTYKGLKENILLENGNFSNELKVYKPSKFCGLILKFKGQSLTYFNSGKCVLVGAKNISELLFYFNYFTLFFQTLNSKCIANHV